MKLKQLIIQNALLLIFSCQITAQGLSPLRIDLGPRELKSVRLLDLVDAIGEEGNLKFAIEDRFINQNGTMIPELCSTIVTGRLPAGTCEEQLKTVAVQVKELKWVLDGQMIWLINRHVLDDSPLLTKVNLLEYQGTVYGLGARLHKFDTRIPDSYLCSYNECNWANNQVVVALTNGMARNVFSTALQEFPAAGCLMQFAEYDAFKFPEGQRSSLPKKFYHWRLLKDPMQAKPKASNGATTDN